MRILTAMELVSNLEVAHANLSHLDEHLPHIRQSLKQVIDSLSGASSNSAWTPTAENVNGLPEPIRKFIHDLETRVDPAGETRARVIAEDCRRALEGTYVTVKNERDQLLNTFRHIHVNNGEDTACKKCGLDLRNPIHLT